VWSLRREREDENLGRKPVAVQLWTLRNEVARDLAGTLSQVARIGYSGVELWFPEYPPVDELTLVLSESNLKAISAHVPFEQLRDGFRSVAHYHKALGNTDLVIPFIPESLRHTEEEWTQRILEIADIAHRCKEEGFRLSYHNHGFEFIDKIAGVEVHDLIFSSVDADLLKAELDTYYVQVAGKDPAQYVRRFGGRLPLLHLKDKKPDRNENTALGDGVIDWLAVFAEADRAGVEWYIVEQDCEMSPPFDSIRRSMEYLKDCDVVYEASTVR